jgi:lipoyl(octanoyl) transferase
MDWSLIVDLVGRPGHENMAIDDALLGRAQGGVGTLRLYRWNPPCLSFGRNEPARKRYDVEAIRALGIDTVRRPTGGRAVWHDAELTYAVAAPCTTFGPLRDTYLLIHGMLANALRRLNIPATLAPPPSGGVPHVGAGACFAAPVGGEIVVEGRKLVGSAQVRHGNAFLQHGSLLLDAGQDLVARLAIEPAAPPAATSLTQILGCPADIESVTSVIAETARTSWEGDWRQDDGSTLVPGSFNFGDAAWTWRM